MLKQIGIRTSKNKFVTFRTTAESHTGRLIMSPLCQWQIVSFWCRR